MNKPGLSIVIPTYNEKNNISKILEKLKKSLKGITYEIIFVDDNSPDGTSFEIKTFIKNSSKIHLIHRVGRRGLAGAIIEGIFAARSELVAVMDCDLQHDETKIRDMLDLFSKDASLDIVIGSRFTSDGEISTNAFSKMRKLGSKVTTFLIKKLLRIKSTDPLFTIGYFENITWPNFKLSPLNFSYIYGYLSSLKLEFWNSCKQIISAFFLFKKYLIFDSTLSSSIHL